MPYVNINIIAVNEEFGPDEFGLEDVLPDGRLAISGMIFGGLLEGLTDQLTRLYEEYTRVVEMLEKAGFEPPAQFRHLTEFTLGRQFEQEIARQQGSRDLHAYKTAIEIVNAAAKRGYEIDKSVANESFGAMINEAVSKAVERPSCATTKASMELIVLARRLELQPNLDTAQERVYQAFQHGIPQVGQLVRLASGLGLSGTVIRRPPRVPAVTEDREVGAGKRGSHRPGDQARQRPD